MYAVFWLGGWQRAIRGFLAGERHVQCAERWVDEARHVLVVDHLADRDVFVVGWSSGLEDVDTFEGYDIEPGLVAACEPGILYHRGTRRVTADVDEAGSWACEALADPGV